MILKDDGKVESTSDEYEGENMIAFEDASNVEYAINGELFVIK
jgi:hypothetical protein